MHVAGLMVFEGEPFFDDDGSFRLEECRRRVASRLHLVPRFRQRVMPVTAGLGRPVWVDHGDFDVAEHVRHAVLPPPGGDGELRGFMAAEQGLPLDRRRPLWELCFVEGLVGGRVALVVKVHHAMIDGAGGVEAAALLLLDMSAEAPIVVDVPPWVPEPPPDPRQLLADTLADQAGLPSLIASSARALLGRREEAGAALAGAGRALAATFGTVAPKTSFNVGVGPGRRFETVRFDEAALRSAVRSRGATVNDAVLAGVAGALHHFLSARGEDVDDLVLRVLVPVTRRRRGSEKARAKVGGAMFFGNQVSALVVDLPVGGADPIERLAKATAAMTTARQSPALSGADSLLSFGDHLPPIALDLVARLAPFQRTVNLAVTNVPGPQFPLWCMGARLLEAFPYVGVVDGMALNVGVLAYDGRLGFGLTGDHGAVPDLGTLAEGLDKSLAELVAAAG